MGLTRESEERLVACSRPAVKTALIIKGNTDYLGLEAYPFTAENILKSLSAAGYGVTLVDGLSPHVALDAIRSGSYEVLVLIGHGDQDNGAVQMRSGSDLAWFSFAGGEEHSEVRHLILFSCYQGQQGPSSQWQTVFPAAELYAWEKALIPLDAQFWAKILPWYYGITPNPMNSLTETVPGFVNILSNVHPTLEPVPSTISIAGADVCNPPTPMNPQHVLDQQTRSTFGNKTFNFGVGGDVPVGIVVSNGAITQFEYSGYPDPQFEVFIEPEEYLQALTDPWSFRTAFAAGKINILDRGSGLSEETIFWGVAGVLFGVSRDTSGSVGLPILSIGGAVGLTLLLALVGIILLRSRPAVIP